MNYLNRAEEAMLEIGDMFFGHPTMRIARDQTAVEEALTEMECVKIDLGVMKFWIFPDASYIEGFFDGYSVGYDIEDYCIVMRMYNESE